MATHLQTNDSRIRRRPGPPAKISGRRTRSRVDRVTEYVAERLHRPARPDVRGTGHRADPMYDLP